MCLFADGFEGFVIPGLVFENGFERDLRCAEPLEILDFTQANFNGCWYRTSNHALGMTCFTNIGDPNIQVTVNHTGDADTYGYSKD